MAFEDRGLQSTEDIQGLEITAEGLHLSPKPQAGFMEGAQGFTELAATSLVILQVSDRHKVGFHLESSVAEAMKSQRNTLRL